MVFAAPMGALEKPGLYLGFSAFSDVYVSAPDARAYFLFDGKKKVAKEKATPGSASGCARSLALLAGPGGLPELACGSNKASRLPPARLRCSAPLKGPTRRLGSINEYITGLLRSTAKNGQKSKSLQHLFSTGRFSGPLERCRATQGFADKGRALSEGQSPELRSPRESRVAQGTGAAGTDPGSPFLCLLSFGEAKESNAAAQRRKTAAQKRHPRIRRENQRTNDPAHQIETT